MTIVQNHLHPVLAEDRRKAECLGNSNPAANSESSCQRPLGVEQGEDLLHRESIRLSLRNGAPTMAHRLGCYTFQTDVPLGRSGTGGGALRAPPFPVQCRQFWRKSGNALPNSLRTARTSPNLPGPVKKGTFATSSAFPPSLSSSPCTAPGRSGAGSWAAWGRRGTRLCCTGRCWERE